MGTKRLLSLLINLMFLLMAIVASASEPRVVRVGAFNYFPGIFQDSDGRVKGFYVDALEEIGRRENIRFEYIYGTWSEGLERIRTGEVDLLTSVAHTPERALYMDYPTTPLLTVWGELYGPQNTRIAGIQDVRGKTVAVMAGDFNGKSFIDLIRKFNIACTFVEYPGFNEVFRAIAAGKVDAGVVNSTFGASRKTEYGVRSTGVIFNPFDIFFTVAKGKNGDLLALLDSYLKQWRPDPDSVYNLARQKWTRDQTVVYRTPAWVKYSALGFFLLISGGTFFIWLLRSQVRRKTQEIVQREASLRESEMRYRNIFENDHLVMMVIDPETGNILDANPAAAAYYGWSREQLREMHVGDINSLGREAVMGEMKRVKFRDRNQYVFRHRLANGTLRDVEVFTGPIKRGGKSLLFSTVRDITERKRIEETYQFLVEAGWLSSKEDFFTALARFLATTLEVDYISIDKMINDGNAAKTVAVHRDGKPAQNREYSLEHTPCHDVVIKSICTFERAVRELFPNDPLLQDLSAESYVATTLWGFNGKPVGLIAAIGRRPLTDPHLAELVLKLVAVRTAGELERKMAEDALLESGERYRTLVEHAPVAVMVNRGNRIVLVNQQCLRLFGAATADQLLGRSPFDLFDPSFHTVMRKRIQQMHETGEPAPLLEEKIVRVDGTPVEVEVGAVPFKDKGTDAIHVVLRDITSQKRYEKELLDKNSELERFTYTVSHDLKSPLITIQFFAGQILHDLTAGKSENVQDDLKKVTEAAGKMNALLNDLLDLSRVGRVMNPSVNIELPLLLDQIVAQLQGPLSQRGVEMEIDPGLPAVHGDPQRIAEVFQNLIENAIKYMGDQRNPRIEIGARHDAHEQVFFVADNGIGIEPRYQDNIFGLFNKLDPSSEGTGVGLALVRRIIETHGGRVWVESAGEGQGSIFCFTLPGARKGS